MYELLWCLGDVEDSLHTDCLTVTGKTVGENLMEADMPYNTDIIRPLDNPLNEKGGISVLYGNLAPKGAVIKRSAASKHLLNHRGPAKVFENLEECQNYLLDENSDVTKDTVIVLRGYGPVGAPGMPENGNYMPDIETLRLLSKAFSVSIEELLDGERLSVKKPAKTPDPFSPKERADFWRRNWKRENRSWFIFWGIIVFAVAVFGFLANFLLFVADFFLALVLYLYFYNQKFLHIL